MNGHRADIYKVNVHNALQIGEYMAAAFKDNLSGGFYKVSKKVIKLFMTWSNLWKTVGYFRQEKYQPGASQGL